MTIKPSEEDVKTAGFITASIGADFCWDGQADNTKSLEELCVDAIAEAIATARLQEREACAKICDEYATEKETKAGDEFKGTLYESPFSPYCYSEAATDCSNLIRNQTP